MTIHTVRGSGPTSRRLEVVERKGIGHPDTMCDGIAERICVRLCRHYRDRFGTILHHNVDKVLLVGGSSRARFGGGEVTAPIEIYLAGRVTMECGGERIAAEDIAVEACREWLREHLRYLDVERHVKIFPRFRPGSNELRNLVGRVRANDTSCGVGFAPSTDLERAVLAVERRLNEPAVKQAHPALGEDVKVMGVRRDEEVVLTIACAFVARHIANADAYEHARSNAAKVALEAAREVTTLDVKTLVNLADDPARGDFYLTVTGSSAESGDDGEVGRGNRIGGLITPNRSMTLEAAAGKNPVSHVGKLYGVLARRIAESIAEEVPDVTDATCMLVSQIGCAIDEPHVADLRVMFAHGSKHGVKRRLEQILRRHFANIEGLREDLLAEKIVLF